MTPPQPRGEFKGMNRRFIVAAVLCALAVPVEPFLSPLVFKRAVKSSLPCTSASSRCRASPLVLRASASSGGVDEQDLNRLQTELKRSIEREDYSEAAKLRNLIREATGGGISEGGWQKIGVPDWLADRAERMGFIVPTLVQRRSMASVAIDGKDSVIRSPTGSGKTLAYLMPLLSGISNELLDEDVKGYLNSFMAGGAPRAGDDTEESLLKLPLGVIVVPSKELGVQVSLTLHQLLGGHRNNPNILPVRIDKSSNAKPGSKTNMFSYKGPRRVKVAAVLDPDTLNASMPILPDYGQDMLMGVHLVVGTPECLSALAKRGHIPFDNARFVVVDEADECARRSSSELDALMQTCKGKVCADGRPRSRLFAGASISLPEVTDMTSRGWLSDPAIVSDSGAEDGKWTVPPSLEHKYVICPENRSLVVLSRMIKNELETQGDSDKEGAAAPPRFIVYARSASEAVRLAEPLQNALWAGLGGSVDSGLWGLSVLLPSAEEEEVLKHADNSTRLTFQSSLRVMEMFNFNQTNVLVTTPEATRGLDFPDVSTVFNLGIVGTPADYLHRSGRVGRIGQKRKGRVLSILDEEGATMLNQLGEELRFSASEMEAPVAEVISEETSEDDKKRFLEDIFHLFGDKSKTKFDEDVA